MVPRIGVVWAQAKSLFELRNRLRVSLEQPVCHSRLIVGFGKIWIQSDCGLEFSLGAQEVPAVTEDRAQPGVRLRPIRPLAQRALVETDRPIEVVAPLERLGHIE